MRRSDFQFDLPEELIAQAPTRERQGSRLLVLDGHSGQLADRQFVDLPGLLHRGDVLVFNNTRVIPARLHGQKESGGKIEILIERVLGEQSALAHVRASKSPKAGTKLLLEGDVEVLTRGREGDLFILDFHDTSSRARKLLQILDDIGHMPLPPYINREDQPTDRERYQTVYARTPGAVAAPTAGLHFDEAMLARLQDMGVETAYVTLHVGAGTFQPVRVDNIAEHHMHSEWLSVSEETAEQVNRAKQDGRRIIAVGTTSVRCLETAGSSGRLEAFEGDTDIFITPGYEFKMVDVLITNFHLPESTLLMLVSAFAGYDHVMAAYRHAVEQKYRFFSYGDVMCITGCKSCIKQ